MSTISTSQKIGSSARRQPRQAAAAAAAAIAAASGAAQASSQEPTRASLKLDAAWFFDELSAIGCDVLLKDLVERNLFQHARYKFRVSGPLNTIPQIELASGHLAVVGLGSYGDTASGLTKALTGSAMRRIGKDALALEDDDKINVLNLRPLQSLHLPFGHCSATDDLAQRLSSWAGMLTVNSKHELLRGYEQYSASNWDGDGAEAITKETLDYAHLLMMGLPDNFGPPEVSPGLDGSIALEWVPENHRNLHKLFLDIGPGPRWRAYWKLRSGEFDRVTGETSEVRPILQPLFDKLS